MLHKKIEEFIKNTGEGVVLDYINGQFVLESKSFAEGKPNTTIKIKAMAVNLNNCIDNFVYQLEQLEYNNSRNDKEDIELYRWYSSY